MLSDHWSAEGGAVIGKIPLIDILKNVGAVTEQSQT